jgi:prophage DNA circulation protein
VDVFDSASVANRAALVSLVRMTGASMVAENVVDCEFSSVDEAERYQDMVYEAFEVMLAETDDVDMYMQAQALEAAALKFLRDGLSQIPYEVEIEIPATNNLLSLVYGAYGDLDELDAVVERNDYRDPLFVKPSDGMLVLCDD